jgi:hypothetical protein
MIDWNFDKMSRIVGMNFSIRAKTPCRSLTDIHLMDRQNEGIEGYDPARHGRFAAGDHVDTNGRDTEKNDAVSLVYAALSIIVQQCIICPDDLF